MTHTHICQSPCLSTLTLATVSHLTTTFLSMCCLAMPCLTCLATQHNVPHTFASVSCLASCLTPPAHTRTCLKWGILLWSVLNVIIIKIQMSYNVIFLPIPTLSCVLASIANNKGTFNPPAFQSLFPFLRSLPLSLLLSLAPSLGESPPSLVSDLWCPA
jgi:hypothetical protein